MLCTKYYLRSDFVTNVPFQLRGSLLEVNPEKEGCIPETEINVDAEMASEILGTPGDKTALESQGISGTDEVTETMQILEAQGIEKVQEMDEVMQIDESLTIPKLEQVSMVGA